MSRPVHTIEQCACVREPCSIMWTGRYLQPTNFTWHYGFISTSYWQKNLRCTRPLTNSRVHPFMYIQYSSYSHCLLKWDSSILSFIAFIFHFQLSAVGTFLDNLGVKEHLGLTINKMLSSVYWGAMEAVQYWAPAVLPTWQNTKPGHIKANLCLQYQ